MEDFWPIPFISLVDSFLIWKSGNTLLFAPYLLAPIKDGMRLLFGHGTAHHCCSLLAIWVLLYLFLFVSSVHQG